MTIVPATITGLHFLCKNSQAASATTGMAVILGLNNASPSHKPACPHWSFSEVTSTMVNMKKTNMPTCSNPQVDHAKTKVTSVYIPQRLQPVGGQFMILARLKRPKNHRTKLSIAQKTRAAW